MLWYVQVVEMPGYALKLYTPKQFVETLKREIPRYMVGREFIVPTQLEQQQWISDVL
jgi:hypothetical protein